MPTIHFLGKIAPSGYRTSITNLPGINFKSAEIGVEFDLAIQVHDSIIDVECKGERLEEPDIFNHAFKVVYDMARTSVNMMSFATGITFSVVLDELIHTDGTRRPFAIQHLHLAQLCTAYSTEPPHETNGFMEIMKIVMAEPALFLALDQLITATSVHHLMAVNSARAIEGLRHAMASAGMSRNQEWELFRTNLNVDEKYLRLITDHSISGRHGEGTFVAGNITSEIIIRAWTIMDRFLEYRKRGNLALPIADFPLLTG
jgi:hypothetical protein